jgi:hypothetical protein
MSATYTCDGCGKTAPAITYGRGWTKPHQWFQREDKDGIQDACSRECIEKVASQSGKSALVLPV